MHFLSWVEAYPCRHSDTNTVVNILLRAIISRFGIPSSLNTFDWTDGQGTLCYFTGQTKFSLSPTSTVSWLGREAEWDLF